MEEVNTLTNYEINGYDHYDSAYDDYLCDDEREDIERRALLEKLEGLTYVEQITTVIENNEVSSSLEKKFEELHIKDIEAFLGCGNHGAVYLVDGGSILPHEKLALKVHRFANAQTVKESGEALALTMPLNNNLNRIYGILTSDGHSVRYIDRLEDANQDDRVVGLFAEHIEGKNLKEIYEFDEMQIESQEEEIKQAVELISRISFVEIERLVLDLFNGLHELHKKNISYDSRSIKPENIFVEITSDNKIKRLVLGDFQRAHKLDGHKEREKNLIFLNECNELIEIDEFQYMACTVACGDSLDSGSCC